ncbi:MAG: 50S ribosomal protein L29 [Polyangia bacterium]
MAEKTSENQTDKVVTKRKAIVAEMNSTSDTDLEARIKRTEEQLFQHRLKRYTNQLANTNLIGDAKRDIARAKTVLAQRAAKGKE